MRIAIHRRNTQPYRYSTIAEHMPPNHKFQDDWSAEKLIAMAERIGPKTRSAIDTVLASKQHPEQGYTACQGILKLAKKYTEDRLERACAVAINCLSVRYAVIESILKNNSIEKYFNANSFCALTMRTDRACGSRRAMYGRPHYRCILGGSLSLLMGYKKALIFPEFFNILPYKNCDKIFIIDNSRGERTMQITISTKQILEAVGSLPLDDKMKLYGKIKDDIIQYRVEEILNSFKTDDITEEEITEIVDHVRSERYKNRR